MKKSLLYIGIALAAIGCTKDADVTPEHGEALTITSSIATRVVGDQWSNGDAIGVYMTTLPGDKEENVKYTTESGDGNFASTTPLYFPTSGSIDLFAYYPHMDNVDLENYPITSSDQYDLLSVTKQNIIPTSSPVALTFEHQLSKISLTIKSGEGLEDGDLANLGVTINNIATSATFDLTSGTVNGDLGAAGEIVMTTADDGLSSSAIAIPQTLSDVSLTIASDKIGTFVSDKLTTTEFAVGMEYEYTVTVNRDKLEISAPNITPWVSSTEISTADIVDIEYKSSDQKYHINSAKGLAAFRDLVNGTGSNSTNATFAGFDESDFDTTTPNNSISGNLTRNIDLSTVCDADNDGTNDTSWTPIGKNSASAFEGTFEGGGYKVSGLYINGTSKLGLFGYIAVNGLVYNVGVSGEVTSTSSEVAGLVSWNEGWIMNCYSEVNVNGDTDATNGSSNVAGIAALNNGNVVNCYNLGNIYGRINIGGIVGTNQAGGYVGYCVSVGGITGTSKVGGVVGWNYTDGGSVPTVKGSFCLNNTTYSIGLNDYTTAAGGLTGNVCDKEYLTSEVFAIIINNGASTYNTNLDENNNKVHADPPTGTYACAWANNSPSDYPTLNFGVAPIYDDKVYDIIYNTKVYEIYSAEGLQAFAAIVNNTSLPDGVVTSGGDHFSFTSAQSTIKGSLMKDIDLGGIDYNNSNAVIAGKEWTPIGIDSSTPYSGTFNGNNKKVSGLYINASSDNQGLFGYNTGTISNLGVDGSVEKESSGSASYVGGVVGYNKGSVTNCYNLAYVEGSYTVGGVVGFNNSIGTLTNCYNSGSVKSNASNGGGVVGQNNGTINNCYNSGGMSASHYSGGVVGYNNGGTITNCYNSATVGGSYYLGGLVGYNNSGTITNCYYDVTVNSSRNSVGTGTGSGNQEDGMSTDNMQAESFVITLNNNAVSLDGACAWVDNSPTGYPTLDFGVTPTTTETD